MAEAGTPRARYRNEVVAQIKRLADAQLEQIGASGLSLSAIARELGMSGPALYRYFPSRDALLSALITDAYNDLADRLTEVTSAAGDREPLREFLVAYRQWALANPHRYRLLYQPPIPGFDPNEQELVASALRSMAVLLGLISRTLPPSSELLTADLVSSFTVWTQDVGIDATPLDVLTALRIWSRLHGFVSLEIAGNFAIMAPATDALFDLELASMLGPRAEGT